MGTWLSSVFDDFNPTNSHRINDERYQFLVPYPSYESGFVIPAQAGIFSGHHHHAAGLSYAGLGDEENLSPLDREPRNCLLKRRRRSLQGVPG